VTLLELVTYGWLQRLGDTFAWWARELNAVADELERRRTGRHPLTHEPLEAGGWADGQDIRLELEDGRTVIVDVPVEELEP
jgi:hypothetical protein